MQKLPKKTDTQGTQRTPAKLPRGIRRLSDPRYAKAPWLLTYFADGKKKRAFFATKTAALEEQAEQRRTAKKHGNAALSYSPGDHAEFTEAKELARGTDLRVVARFWAERHRPNDEPTPTVQTAIDRLTERKEDLKRSDPQVADLTTRLKVFASTFGARPFDTLTSREVIDWALSLAKTREKCGPRSIQNYFAAVRTLCIYGWRQGWAPTNPLLNVDPKTELPTVPSGRKGILTVPQGQAMLDLFHSTYPQFVPWLAIQVFRGVRDAEANRFQGEWIDAKEKTILVPGWFIDSMDEAQPGSKTRDDWLMDDLPKSFWTWLPKKLPSGTLPAPGVKLWKKIKARLAALPEPQRIPTWPSNALRHSFATYDLSAYRDPGATSVRLRHQNSRRLWSNYLAKLVSREVGLAWLNMTPSKKTTSTTS